MLQRAWAENIAGKLRLMSNITTRSLTELQDAERNHRAVLEPILACDVESAKRRITEHIEDAWPLARGDSPTVDSWRRNRLASFPGRRSLVGGEEHQWP